jgi:hypothetical protein
LGRDTSAIFFDGRAATGRGKEAGIRALEIERGGIRKRERLGVEKVQR